MNRNEFMEKLEYLLSDIPEEEKADALAYYRDYLDEAGDEAGQVIEEFGSPERIASIIRSELSGNLEEGGTFTERGYEDERFREPNYQIVKRLDLPEEQGYRQTGGEKQEEKDRDSEKKKRAPRTSRPLKIALWIILICVASPLWVGAGGMMVGMTAGILGLLVGAIALLGTMTVALLLAGAGLCVVGILGMLNWFASGLLMFGAGVVIIGLGILNLLLSIIFYGRFIPWLIRCVVNGISRLFHGRRRGEK